MRALVVALSLCACGPASLEVAPRSTSAPAAPANAPSSISTPASQPTEPSSKPSRPPTGAAPLGVVIRIDAFLEGDPLAKDAELYVGLLCESSLEGLFLTGKVARGLVRCGTARVELELTEAVVTEIFSPKNKLWQDRPLNFDGQKTELKR